MDPFEPAPAHEYGVLWRRGQAADLYLSADLQRELGVGLQAWLKLGASRGVYCVAYRLPGGHDTVYAGRAPTLADYEAARADPLGVAVGLIREDLAARAQAA
jgi:hypothetical protein